MVDHNEFSFEPCHDLFIALTHTIESFIFTLDKHELKRLGFRRIIVSLNLDGVHIEALKLAPVKL